MPAVDRRFKGRRLRGMVEGVKKQEREVKKESREV